jgi:hypothetical protein
VFYSGVMGITYHPMDKNGTIKHRIDNRCCQQYGMRVAGNIAGIRSTSTMAESDGHDRECFQTSRY